MIAFGYMTDRFIKIKKCAKMRLRRGFCEKVVWFHSKNTYRNSIVVGRSTQVCYDVLSNKRGKFVRYVISDVTEIDI